MIKAMRKLVVVASGFALTFGLAAGTASALPVAFYLVPSGPPGPRVVPGLATETDQLWVDPSLEPTGITYGIGDTKIIGGGQLSITGFTSVFPGSVISLIGGVLTVASTGDAIGGNSAAFEIATVTIKSSANGTPGDVTVWSGDYLDGNFTQQNVVTPQVIAIAAAVPEPGTLLLLGAGMGGLAVLVGRARRKS